MPRSDEDRLLVGRLLLGARVRERRKAAGLQLTELAERAGLSQAFLSDLERGRKLPNLTSLDALARALETVAVELMEGVYPWGALEAPDEPPAPVPDGRAGRVVRRPRRGDDA